MADYAEFDEREGLSRTGLIRGALDIFGTLLVVVAPLWCIYAIATMPEEATGFDHVLGILARTLWGVVAGVTLLALSELIRRVGAMQRASESAPRGADYSTSFGAGAQRRELDQNILDTLEELVILTREVRDISLLNEQQRALRLEAQGRAVLELLQREVPLLLQEHNWIEARRRVQQARERFPHLKEWDRLEKQIEQMRAQVETRDIEDAERQIKDLTSLGAWDRVAEVVKELLERHPDSAKANELARRLRDQRHKAEAEQRARLMAQAQEATNKREWKAALAAANALIQRFPQSPEAQALRLQLPTLQENAEIQTRKQIENEISELIKQRRFEEALRLTHDLINQYPDSPQATKAREMLPKLEEKVASMGGRRY